MGKKKGNKLKKTVIKAPQPPSEEPEELTRAPHSFVIHRGTVGKHVMQLMKDFRKVMEPFTASSLKVNKKNALKDFVSISSLLHVSHMTIFTITETSPYMRLARLPQGPTLTFKIHDYCLSRDVVSSLRKQYMHSKCFLNSPLIIMNGFSGEGQQLKLMSTMFQSMFPTLNVVKLNLNTIKRCVILNYNEETKCIDFRHFIIRVTPTGLNRGVKKLVMGKIPNLAKYKDVSDFVHKDELLSDLSEAEDEGSHVVVPQKLTSKGNQINNTSAIRLTEIGPRMTLQLVKVEGGLMDGEVMFHEYVHKTEEEMFNMKKQRRIKRRLKEMRRREQEKNVQRKEEEKIMHKEKCLEGMKQKATVKRENKETEASEEVDQNSNDNSSEAAESEENRTDISTREENRPKQTHSVNDDDVENPTLDADDEDDDAEWYRKEVGQEPDPDLFSSPNRGMKRRGGPFNRRGSFKKARFSSGRSGPGGERSQDRFKRDQYGQGGSRGRGTRMRLGTGRGRFQRGRGGFSSGSRQSFSNRDDFTRDGGSRGSSRGGGTRGGRGRGGFSSGSRQSFSNRDNFTRDGSGRGSSRGGGTRGGRGRGGFSSGSRQSFSNDFSRGGNSRGSSRGGGGRGRGRGNRGGFSRH